jgi:hypothetical protein
MRKLVAQEDLVALDILPWGGKLGPAQMLGDKVRDGELGKNSGGGQKSGRRW